MSWVASRSLRTKKPPQPGVALNQIPRKRVYFKSARCFLGSDSTFFLQPPQQTPTATVDFLESLTGFPLMQHFPSSVFANFFKPATTSASNFDLHLSQQNLTSTFAALLSAFTALPLTGQVLFTGASAKEGTSPKKKLREIMEMNFLIGF